jgi:hypothetical protein
MAMESSTATTWPSLLGRSSGCGAGLVARVGLVGLVGLAALVGLAVLGDRSKAETARSDLGGRNETGHGGVRWHRGVGGPAAPRRDEFYPSQSDRGPVGTSFTHFKAIGPPWGRVFNLSKKRRGIRKLETRGHGGSDGIRTLKTRGHGGKGLRS